jgi:hypothetical protein
VTNPVTLDDCLRLLIAWLVLSAMSFIFRRQLLNLTQPVLLGVLGRLLLAWLILSVLGLMYGKAMLSQLLPLLTWMINSIQDDYSASLTITDLAGGQLQLLASLRHDIAPLVKGDTLNIFNDTMHFVIPLLLLVSVFFAWPVKHFQARIKLLLLVIPIGLMSTALTVPFQLAGATEMAFQSLAHQTHLPREKPFYLLWVRFLEDGGGWLRSIAVAMVGVAMMQRTGAKPVRSANDKGMADQ